MGPMAAFLKFISSNFRRSSIFFVIFALSKDSLNPLKRIKNYQKTIIEKLSKDSSNPLKRIKKSVENFMKIFCEQKNCIQLSVHFFKLQNVSFACLGIKESKHY